MAKKGKPLPKRKVRTETDDRQNRPSTGKPTCPIHQTQMEYDSADMRWRCVFDDCKQVAFPASDVKNGRPILGKGRIEVIRVDDPDGDKRGRTIIRAGDNNVMLDVTDFLIQAIPGTNGGATLQLELPFMTDSRTRGRD